MDKKTDNNKPKTGEIKPEVLKPQSGKNTDSNISTAASKLRNRLYHNSYRPSHKATFIGLGVVIVIIAINAGVIMLLINNNQTVDSALNQSDVTINSSVLDSLGVNNTTSVSGSILTVNPDAKFGGSLTVSGKTTISGELSLNSKLTATDASFTKLEAGETLLEKLNVNGDATISNLNLRENLIVAGASNLQGAVTISQLLTVNNNVNITGNLAVGGTLSARGFQASSLVSDTTLTIGGHIVTRGDAPSFTRGTNLRATDTISLSGNDAAGTITLNVGAGSISGGCFISASFVNNYTSIPHFLVTAVGPVTDVYVYRSTTGFSICFGGTLSYGGYAFDYLVTQ